MNYTLRELAEARCAVYPMMYRKAEGEPHKFSSTQFNLSDGSYTRTQGSPLESLTKLVDAIPDSELADDGKESPESFHITVKFGIHDNEPDDVRSAVEGFGPVEVTLGKVSIFAGSDDKDYDVVKVDIEGESIHRLNKLISESVEVTDTHPTYKPHLTLAYVKKGEGEKYVGDDSVEGMKLSFDRLQFSDKQREHTSIKL